MSNYKVSQVTQIYFNDVHDKLYLVESYLGMARVYELGMDGHERTVGLMVDEELEQFLQSEFGPRTVEGYRNQKEKLLDAVSVYC